MTPALSIRRLDTSDPGFEQQLADLAAQAEEGNAEIADRVRAIIADVRARGDAAVLEYAARFDGVQAASVDELRLSPERIREISGPVREEAAHALKQAGLRIQRYARKQKLSSWSYRDEGASLTQRVTALDAVGLYVPGGKASYPSSVLMNAIPAKVAGVERIAMMMPAPGGEIAPLIACALLLTGVEEVYTIGGAHAIAALVWGTETIAPVCKIAGPGNAYVAEAKRQVFGRVGIDMVAGPSEIMIICDGRTDPAWIACDLFSQAEHDESARAMLLCPDRKFIDKVLDEMNTLIKTMPRAEIIRKSLRGQGLLLKVRDLTEAVGIANRIAPEHLELSVEDPEELLDDVKNAGAVFLGRHTSEVLGDYCAGPNHVLPTGGAAAFFSPLGTYDFQKHTSLVQCSPQCAAELGVIARQLAEAEGLPAHAASAACRIPK